MLHLFQRRILFDLLFEKHLRYSELKPAEIENSQFMFHMHKLIEEGLVQKQGINYQLTQKGKEFANKLDVTELNIAIQTKVTTEICAVKNDEILIYKRLKNPFYGCHGFPTQKVLYGEQIVDAAIKGLKEETNLTGTPQLFSIKHYLVYSKQNEIIEDKLMHGFIFTNIKGTLESNKEGDYFWSTPQSLTHLKPFQPEFHEFYEDLVNFKSEITYKEYKITTDLF